MDVYMGTVMSFAFSFAPRNWAMCNGQLLAISSNSALFALLGTTYGGNGQTTFALPNIQGRNIIGYGTDTQGTMWEMGQMAGNSTTTMLISNMPMHNHTTATTIAIPAFADNGATTDPSSAVFAISSGGNAYSDQPADVALRPFQENIVVNIAGGSQPFSNLSPYQVVNYSIALYGIFPSRN